MAFMFPPNFIRDADKASQVTKIANTCKKRSAVLALGGHEDPGDDGARRHRRGRRERHPGVRQESIQSSDAE